MAPSQIASIPFLMHHLQTVVSNKNDLRTCISLSNARFYTLRCISQQSALCVRVEIKVFFIATIIEN